MNAIWLVLTYDLLEDLGGRIDDVNTDNIDAFLIIENK